MVVELAERIRNHEVGPDTVLPLPGHGDTAARHRGLLELGRRDLSLARIAEAHTDALAILAEADRRPRAGKLYGVWASDAPPHGVTATRLRNGWRLDGVKPYCSGASIVSAALVTARADGANLLFDVPLDLPGIEVLPTTWATPALADTATRRVRFCSALLPIETQVGGDDWYLNRPGFWHGALGPAACWAGGAASLVHAACALNRKDPHARANLGALHAAAWGMAAMLDQAAREIDADPTDVQAARIRALTVRHLIERCCTDVLDRFGRATGPQLLCFDPQVARQHMALVVYLRQCHAERDLANLWDSVDASSLAQGSPATACSSAPAALSMPAAALATTLAT